MALGLLLGGAAQWRLPGGYRRPEPVQLGLYDVQCWLLRRCTFQELLAVQIRRVVERWRSTVLSYVACRARGYCMNVRGSRAQVLLMNARFTPVRTLIAYTACSACPAGSQCANALCSSTVPVGHDDTGDRSCFSLRAGMYF